jgi:hypothetical protein
MVGKITPKEAGELGATYSTRQLEHFDKMVQAEVEAFASPSDDSSSRKGRHNCIEWHIMENPAQKTIPKIAQLAVVLGRRDDEPFYVTASFSANAGVRNKVATVLRGLNEKAKGVMRRRAKAGAVSGADGGASDKQDDKKVNSVGNRARRRDFNPKDVVKEGILDVPPGWEEKTFKKGIPTDLRPLILGETLEAFAYIRETHANAKEDAAKYEELVASQPAGAADKGGGDGGGDKGDDKGDDKDDKGKEDEDDKKDKGDEGGDGGKDAGDGHDESAPDKNHTQGERMDE